MALGDTKIIDGARSPGEIEKLNAEAEEKERQRKILAAAAAPHQPKATPKAPYPTRFVSASSTYLLLLDKTAEQPDGSIKHTKFHVKFEHGMLDISRRTYPVATRIVSELMTAASGYGLGRSFWDADEAEAVLAAAARKQTFNSVKAAKADPALRAALIAELQADDFDVKG